LPFFRYFWTPGTSLFFNVYIGEVGFVFRPDPLGTPYGELTWQPFSQKPKLLEFSMMSSGGFELVPESGTPQPT
jgi:hypothetical protein